MPNFGAVAALFAADLAAALSRLLTSHEILLNVLKWQTVNRWAASTGKMTDDQGLMSNFASGA
jgi:hypothetical protein